jgi:hypothetical protein
VTQKYSIKIKNFDIYKLFDQNKIEYILMEDIVISKKKCNELWNIIVENKEYNIEYYGFNFPFINCYYRIIALQEMNESDLKS